MKKILLMSIVLTALFAQCSLVSSVYADATYTVGTGKTYATIQAAIDAIPGDLSGQGVQTVEVYAGGSQEGSGYFYDEQVNASSGFSNASASDYIVLKAMVPNQGKRDTGIIIRKATGGAIICVYITAYTRVIGFGFTLTGVNDNTVRGIYAAGNAVQIIGNVLYNIKTDNQWLMLIDVTDRNDCIFRNNMIMDYGSATAASSSCGIHMRRVSNNKVYNNTFVNSSGTYEANGIWFRDLGAGNVAKNNYAGSNYVSFYQTEATDPAVTYCISSDNTATNWGGVGNQINKPTANQFINATEGSEDLFLKKGADCIDAGEDLSGQGFTDDIYCKPRPYGSAWDVGAHEYVPEGSIFYSF